MNILLGAGLSYLFGSTPTAYLIFKKKKGEDIRKYGYKNMGTLNIYHLLGPFHAFITFLINSRWLPLLSISPESRTNILSAFINEDIRCEITMVVIPLA
ncbi:unnamed protein product [marine sediment metagenome]|uniref:Uncharacterized protein n=1 Tax=marine sediment metagenome TaxID=412755 RepID=X1M6C6_9ZZZZ